LILITGGSGFVGKHLRKRLLQTSVTVSLRQRVWVDELKKHKPNIIVHLAGYANSQGTEQAFQQANVEGTRVLADAAVRQGVQRFVFLSSIQAVADSSSSVVSFDSRSAGAPAGAYGRSKRDAEDLLRRLSMKSRMEVIIIRPPLVYGPGVKANFRKMFGLVEKGFPIPMVAIDRNRRSFVAVSNLVDLILRCLSHPAAANQTFHVSDDDDVSTAELLRRIGKALGKSVRNLPIPAPVLKGGLHLAGKGEWVEKLFGNLRVDIEHTKRTLGWEPVVKMEEELERTAKWWRESRQGQL
jgi:nucleoside-diphosphate-sugar epimerase